MTVVVDDPTQRTYTSPIPVDEHFSLFRNGFLLNEGDEFAFGPGPGEITLSVDPVVGDKLTFRRL